MIESMASAFSRRVVFPVHPGVPLVRIKRDILTHGATPLLKVFPPTAYRCRQESRFHIFIPSGARNPSYCAKKNQEGFLAPLGMMEFGAVNGPAAGCKAMPLS